MPQAANPAAFQPCFTPPEPVPGLYENHSQLDRRKIVEFDGRGERLTSPTIIFDEQSDTARLICVLLAGSARFCGRMQLMYW